MVISVGIDVSKEIKLLGGEVKVILEATGGCMSGVGEVLAPRLIAEIGDVRRFHSGSALVAFAGLDSPPYESGQFIGTKRKISKRGSALLRKTGYEVMKCLKTVKPKEDSAIFDCCQWRRSSSLD